MKWLKRLRCKHKKQECITNLHGDLIWYVSNHRKDFVRSIWICKDCGKIVYKGYLNPNCKNINFDG